MKSCLRLLYNSTLRFDKYRVVYGRYSSTQSNTTGDDIIDITSVEEVPKYDNELTEEEAQEIMRKRNKSKLNVADRNRLSELPPYNNEDLTWFHQSIRFKRRMFGRYGMSGLNVPAGALWPLQDEILDKLEYEKVARPHTVQEGWALISKRNHEQAETIRLREAEITMKMKKVEQWRKEFYARIAKKEAAVREAKERKERLIQEVRRELGFKVDPHDDRFKEALERKEKEDKKRKKEAKKKARTAHVMAKILAQNTPANEAPTQTGSTEKPKE